MSLKSVKTLKTLNNKTVLLRVDFNVALKAGKIEDDFRIRAGLETIDYLLTKGAKIIIIAHLGEPNGKPTKNLSLSPVATRLKSLLKKPVKFLPLTIGPKVALAVNKMKSQDIIFLENIRFNPGEMTNDAKFARELAQLADIYVNDAFAVSHRPQASVGAIKKYLPSYAGLLLTKEVNALNKILKPKKPLVVLMGGAKISTKAPLIKKLLPSANQVLIGGALANNFFKFQKMEIGQSIFDAGSEQEIKKFFKGKAINQKIKLPLDVVVKMKNGRAQVKEPRSVKKDELILDIGPKTIALYSNYIKKANTIVWNGPLGKFEEKSFKHGTMSIARLVASRASGLAYGLVGGGETVAALKQTKMTEYVDWVSTAGGAMLTYLGGGKMPGL